MKNLAAKEKLYLGYLMLSAPLYLVFYGWGLVIEMILYRPEDGAVDSFNLMGELILYGVIFFGNLLLAAFYGFQAIFLPEFRKFILGCVTITFLLAGGVTLWFLFTA